MNRDQKAVLVKELTVEIGGSPTMFVADYRGLDMPGITELRGKLRDADADFRVVKNTLARRAAVDAGLDGIADMLRGPSAIAFVRGDAAAVAKALRDFGKTRDGLLELRGGIMDGRMVDAAQISDIAELPSRQVILAMLVSAVNAPMSMTVGVLNAPLRDILLVLDAYIEKRRAAGEEG